MFTDKELFEGFTEEQAICYSQEARKEYGNEMVENTEQKIREMPKEKWDAIRIEGDDINRALASLMNEAPSDARVQALVRRHHAWIQNFYAAPKALYEGLGLLYTQHPEFRAHYEKFGHGLADFLNEAINYYCTNELK